MKIDLYPCFNHLKKYNTIWIYSDPHFSDEEMSHIRKNYLGDEEQTKRINSKVGKNDVIIFLGDIGDPACIGRIKGYKILVMGNHDKGKSNYERKVVDGVDNHLFDEVYTGVVMLNDKVLLSHEPVYLNFVYNIHGHDHSNVESSHDGLHLNVCAEHIDYYPISLNKLVKEGTFKNVRSIHEKTIHNVAVKKMFKEIFGYRENNAPDWDEVFCPCNNLPPKYECDCIGIIKYKGSEYHVYADDYGCQDFIVYRYFDNDEIKEHHIAVRNMAGELDWWYELDRMKAEYPNEIQ